MSDDIKRLSEIINADNVMDVISDDEISEITRAAIDGYEQDDASRTEWVAQAEHILKLASLKPEPKDTPRKGAASIKYPLIATAVLQLAARMYPELVRDGHVVNIGVMGNDPDGSKTAKAADISDHMDYQLLTESTEWEVSIDKLLTNYLTVGLAYQKIYFDKVSNTNKYVFCDFKEVIVHDDVASLKDAPRITHVMKLSTRRIIEMIRAEIFSVDSDDEQRIRDSVEHQDLFHTILEQHCFADLDDDGLEEPYIVTIHKDTNLCLRITPRFDHNSIKFNSKGQVKYIEADQYFEDYHCITRFDGKFHSYGVGTILLHPNETVNTTYNQLLDAGYNANMQTMLMSTDLELAKGTHKVDNGQIIPIKNNGTMPMSQGFMPFTFKEPSQVLFALLQMTIEAGKTLGGSTDVMTGNANPQNSPAYTIAMLAEQGQKVYTSIQRRFYRAFKGSLDKAFKLNAKYLPPQSTFQKGGNLKTILQQDYNDPSFMVRPVVDPNMSSETQQMMKAEAVYQMIVLDQTTTPQQKEMARQDLLKAMKVPNPERFLTPPQPPQPNPEAIQLQLDAKKHDDDMEIKRGQLQLKAIELQAKAPKMDADTTKSRAQAVHQLAVAAALHETDNNAKAELGLENKRINVDMTKHVLDHGLAVVKEVNSQNQMSEQGEPTSNDQETSSTK